LDKDLFIRAEVKELEQKLDKVIQDLKDILKEVRQK